MYTFYTFLFIINGHLAQVEVLQSLPPFEVFGKKRAFMFDQLIFYLTRKYSVFEIFFAFSWYHFYWWLARLLSPCA